MVLATNEARVSGSTLDGTPAAPVDWAANDSPLAGKTKAQVLAALKVMDLLRFITLSKLHMYHLRRRLGDTGAQPQTIGSVGGFGYRMII